MKECKEKQTRVNRSERQRKRTDYIKQKIKTEYIYQNKNNRKERTAQK